MKCKACTFLLLLLLCGAVSSCHKRIESTTVAVKDSVRHYYPVIAGQILNVTYELENTGDQPLMIKDIQPSCGCITPKLNTNMVLPGRKMRMLFKYESAKNIGYVEHTIRIYGNVKPHGIVKLKFDVNVVPNADYTRDYEELYKEAVEKSDIIRGLVDGDESEKGYYVDIKKDSRSHKKYLWRDK